MEISFLNGDINQPYISGFIFRAGLSKDSELYRDFPQWYGQDAETIILGQKSGKILRFKNDSITVMDETGRGLEVTSEGVRVRADSNSDWEKVIGYESLSEYLLTVTDALGVPVFPQGLPGSVDIFS